MTLSKLQIQLPDHIDNIPNLEFIGVNNCPAYRFTGGVYDGIVYTYTDINIIVVDDTGLPIKVKFSEVSPENGHSLKIGFKFFIFENPNNKDVDTEHFMSYIGNILTKIIGSVVDNGGTLDTE